MKRSIFLLILLALASMFTSACSDSTAPSTTSAIVLKLETVVETSGGETYVRAESSVTNTGSATVHYPIRCGNPGAITAKDGDGVWLVLRDPALVPICPPGFDSLAAGETLEGGIDLVWAWDENGDKYLIPPGHYTVRTAFTYYYGGTDKRLYLEREMLLDLE